MGVAAEKGPTKRGGVKISPKLSHLSKDLPKERLPELLDTRDHHTVQSQK